MILTILICIYLFLNLGNFIDITQKAEPADIIVSLGGGSGCRIQKALALYEDGYSTSKKIIYTHKDYIGKNITHTLSRKQYLHSNGIKLSNIIHIDENTITNTMEEVFFIKKYMLRHNYKSVNFITHPQHSRRIKELAEKVANYDEDGLTLSIISCTPSWWNKNKFYLNKMALKVTTLETIKLFYNFIKYGTPLIYYTKYFKRVENEEWQRALDKLDQ